MFIVILSSDVNNTSCVPFHLLSTANNGPLKLLITKQYKLFNMTCLFYCSTFYRKKQGRIVYKDFTIHLLTNLLHSNKDTIFCVT